MQVDERERTQAGQLTAAEQDRRHQAWLDAQPEVRRCGLEACHEPGWSFKGTVAEGREAFAAHAAGHPAPPPKETAAARRRRVALEQAAGRQAQIAQSEARDALAAMDAGEPQPLPPDPEPAPVPTPDPPAAPATNGGPVRTTATQAQASRYGATQEERAARAIDDIKALAARLGRPPATSDDTALSQRAKLAHGSWANAVELAGFPRPSKTTRYRRGPAPPQRAPEAATAPVAAPEPLPDLQPRPSRAAREARPDGPLQVVLDAVELLLARALFENAARSAAGLGRELAGQLEQAGRPEEAEAVRARIGDLA